MASEPQPSSLPQPTLPQPTLPQPTLPQKFLRYRSVRQANATKQANCPPVPFQSSSPTQNTPVLRSKSRYHRKPKSVDATVATEQHIPSGRVLHSHSASLAALTGEWDPPSPGQSALIPPLPEATRVDMAEEPAFGPMQKRSIPKHPQQSSSQPPRSSRSEIRRNLPDHDEHTRDEFGGKPQTIAEQEAQGIVKSDDERIRRLKAQRSAVRESERARKNPLVDETRQREISQWHSKVADTMSSGEDGGIAWTNIPRTTPTRDNLAEMMRKEVPYAAQDDQHHTALNSRTDASRPGKTNSFSVGARRTPPEASRSGRTNSSSVDAGRTPPEASPSSPRKLSVHQTLRTPLRSRKSPQTESPERLASADASPSNHAHSPSKSTEAGPSSFDAPISAANAGDRRVVVKFNLSSVTLTVTPRTTSLDLLKSAAACMSEAVDMNHSLLVESFSQLGLERSLRSYEYVRDVMNSWDHDLQNHFTIVPDAIAGTTVQDLDFVPNNKPAEISVYMYHSQKPGSWNKRWITLKPDGQVSIAKHNDGSDSSNICHLSDFDIYKPAQRQLKKLKPPKKICFAIKSLEKSAMFLSGTNFVHFFATSDKATAARWYDTVHEWRSWYLVNVLGEGKDPVPQQDTSGSSNLKLSGSLISPSWQQAPPRPGANISPDRVETRVQPGMTVEQRSPRSIPVHHSRNLSSRNRCAPPTSFPKHSLQETQPCLPSPARGHAPSISGAGGGRTNSIRSSRRSGPSSPNLKRSTSTGRAASIRQMPIKPLIDLTPQFVEQPQHIRKGHGVVAEPGRPLIDLATDVEVLPGAIFTPAARALRRPMTTESVFDGSNGSSDGVGPTNTSVPDLPRPTTEAFTGTGLLASSKSIRRAPGGVGHGHGVKNGDRNAVGKPLVDLKLESQFADGSLLRQVERATQNQGGVDDWGIVVDREKRIERNVRVGEGV